MLLLSYSGERCRDFHTEAKATILSGFFYYLCPMSQAHKDIIVYTLLVILFACCAYWIYNIHWSGCIAWIVFWLWIAIRKIPIKKLPDEKKESS